MASASPGASIAAPSFTLHPPALSTTASFWHLDALRVAGIIAVVVLHVSLGLIHYRALDPADLELCLAINALTWWAVPVFVMISGALLLDPMRWHSTGDFYRRRLARIGWPLIFWCAFYLVWPMIFPRAAANRFPDLKEARGWQGLWLGAPYYHLHFLFLIAGLYLVAPLLVLGIRCWGRAFAWSTMLGGFLLTAPATWLMAIGDCRPNLLVRSVPFVPYFLAGYCLKDAVLGPRNLLALLVLLVALAMAEERLLAWAHQHWTWISHEKAIANYLSPPVIGLSLGIFVVVRTLGARLAGAGPFRQRPWQALAGATFGVYLVHPLVLDLLARLTRDGARLACPRLVEIAAGTVTTLGLSFLITWAWQRTPGLRRFVG